MRTGAASIWGAAIAIASIAGPFLVAGTLRWAAGWVALATTGAGLVVHGRYVARRRPELRDARRRIGAGTPAWDVAWNLLYWPMMIAIPVTAGLGVRRGWPEMAPPLWGAGVALLAGGLALTASAMAANPHYEGTVRIQSDRGHRVVDVGPYRRVRHPGYAGLALCALASPFLVRSWRALWPAALVVAWLVLRTALEDRFLRRRLPGYGEYARRTPARLVPGVW